MDINTKEKRDTLETLAWQILTVAPIFKKRLFRPDFEQGENALPMSYVQVLAALNEADSMTVSEISARFDIAKPNITPLIDRMIEAGYVKRVRNSTDRRVVHVVIQDKGREKVNQIAGSLKNSIAKWSSGILETEIKKVSDAISVIHSVLKETE